MSIDHHTGVPLVEFRVIEQGNSSVMGWVNGISFRFTASVWTWRFCVWQSVPEFQASERESALRPPSWERTGDVPHFFRDLTDEEMRELVFQCAAQFAADIDWAEPEPMDFMYAGSSGTVYVMEW